jgi:lysine-N-methylase
MSSLSISLPVLQNWDCHVCGDCCKQYIVTISQQEHRRIEGQGWSSDPEIGGAPLFARSGPFWARRYQLNRRSDGSCIFLSEQGRCRIHERFGYETKPLPCRLFPFVLVPVADHWRVGMRYACPSAAANKGRSLGEHVDRLKQFAAELARREGLDVQQGEPRLRPPRLQRRQRVDWPDLLRLVEALSAILRNKRDRMERRLRKCIGLADLCKQARFDEVRGKRLSSFLALIIANLDVEIPADPAALSPLTWVGRVLFRQALAVFTRRDQGPLRGLSKQGRLALFLAGWRFARGKGPVPRMHTGIPETTFEKIESSPALLSSGVEEILERYYTIKVESLSFCGAANFNLPFWEGLEMLVLTFPVVLWVMRALADRSPVEAVTHALTIVDDHFGFNRVLQSRRQRVAFRLLARSNELPKLVGWYAKEKIKDES